MSTDPDLILISGCSGGGKSTLVEALRSAGHAVVPEPGRRIVAEERATGGTALPWTDPAAFARRAVDLARADLATARTATGPVFFDRGLVDAAVALEHAAGIPLADTLGSRRHYANPVYLAPPWPEIFASDADRRHDLSAAIAEYERLETAFRALGYTVRHLPRASVEDRLAVILG